MEGRPRALAAAAWRIDRRRADSGHALLPCFPQERSKGAQDSFSRGTKGWAHHLANSHYSQSDMSDSWEGGGF